MTAPPWKHAIVVGASSGIGAEIARQLGAAGCRVGLVARRASELARVAADIDGGTRERALVAVHDVTAYATVPNVIQRLCDELGGLDLLVYAAGAMPAVGAREYAFAKDQAIMEVNVLGAMAWLNAAAERFARRRAGSIVGISSVAGDRGRRGNPGYCAAKAALTAYLEALRNRLAPDGVAVVTVKPGPVDTPMTADVTRKPLLISAERAAREIIAGARNGASTVYVPRVWQPIMFVIRHLPSAIMRRLDI